MTSASIEAPRGYQHIARVFARWWLLIALGAVLATGFGAAVGAASPEHFTADAQVLINQPAQALEPNNGEAVQRLSQLMKTLSQLATSDAVLNGVRQQVGSQRSVSDLRGHVSATVSEGALTLTLHTDFPTDKEAAQVCGALVSQFSARVASLSDHSPSSASKLSVEVLQSPQVGRVSSGLLRTVLVAFVLGLGFSTVAAFALDKG